MSISFTGGEISRIRADARRLHECAATRERQLEALIATIDVPPLQFEMMRSGTPDSNQLGIDHLTTALRAQLDRSHAAVLLAKELCVAARTERMAVQELRAHLRDAHDDGRQTQAAVTGHAVLVVDDYDEIREVLASVLEAAGFVVRTASNGLEAIIAAYEMRPAVIVMDVVMPVLDGLEATRLIKAIDAVGNARVIAHTGTLPLNDPAIGMFAAVLQKPVAPSVVVAMVQQCAQPS